MRVHRGFFVPLCNGDDDLDSVILEMRYRVARFFEGGAPINIIDDYPICELIAACRVANKIITEEQEQIKRASRK